MIFTFDGKRFVWNLPASIDAKCAKEHYAKSNSFEGCTIKLFTGVIYGFQNKLEGLCLANLSSLV
jgi:hypothetical protein